jgi:fatty-acyl-CoA synthase
MAAVTTVGLTDIATRLPGLLMDAPVFMRGAFSGLLARPTAKTSIGKVFQERAEHYGDHAFIKFGDETVRYRQANETANRYAAVLAAHGVGRGDVVGIMLKNSPRTVLLMLAVVKLGAIAGMLNYNQHGEVLAHSIGLLDAKLTIAEPDLLKPIDESGAKLADCLITDDLERLAADAPTANPAVTSAVLAKDKAFYIFTSGTTGFPKASVMTHYRWLRAMSGFGELGLRLHRDDVLYSCLPLYHNNALTVAVGSVLSAGATLALGKSFSASRFWDEVIDSGATAFVYIGEICRYLLNQPPKPTDRGHKVRVIVGNGLRPEIWDEFTQRFGIKRVCEFYAASEGNTAFVNVLNVPKTTGICPTPIAFVAYDPDTGEPLRDERGRVRKVPHGEPGLLLSKVSNLQPFDGYTDPKATEKKLVRNAFRDGDVWFNTGDLMRPQGFGHAAFVDRLGDTFRWKGENVATTEVEAAVSAEPAVEEATVFGVQIPDTDGRAGMAAVKLRDGARFDGKSLAAAAYARLPGYALPLFVRVVDSLEHTSTFKSRKVDLREQGYGPRATDPLYVLAGRDEGYVPFYDGYVDDVKKGTRPQG